MVSDLVVYALVACSETVWTGDGRLTTRGRARENGVDGDDGVSLPIPRFRSTAPRISAPPSLLSAHCLTTDDSRSAECGCYAPLRPPVNSGVRQESECRWTEEGERVWSRHRPPRILQSFARKGAGPWRQKGVAVQTTSTAPPLPSSLPSVKAAGCCLAFSGAESLGVSLLFKRGRLWLPLTAQPCHNFSLLPFPSFFYIKFFTSFAYIYFDNFSRFLVAQLFFSFLGFLSDIK